MTTAAAAPDRISRIAASLAVVICLGFAAFTHHAWEDYLITFRASLNLATGHGLVFQEGERVHTFTSPLGTLLPALFALGGGPEVEYRALWLFRLASSLALGGAVWLAAREFLRAGLARGAAIAGCALWLCDPKIVDFSINGMESALLIFFIVLTWRALVTGARPWPLALGFAGLQWTRPDGFVFFGALAAGWLCWGGTSPGTPAPARWRALGRGVVRGLVCYLPWIGIAWLYYGSPIPHTIIAKHMPQPLGETVGRLALYPWHLLNGQAAIHNLFMPAYFFLGGWPAALMWFSRLLATGAALGWLWPRVKAGGRIASAAVFLGGFYLDYIPWSPWYLPGWQVLACMVWAYLWDALDSAVASADAGKKFLRSLVRVTGLLLVAMQIALLVAVGWQMRQQQNLIEDTHRREIGRWLRTHAAPGDRVYLEPLGYIGYYSGLKMLDHPGLASPEVVAARRSGHEGDARIIAALRPEWLVLRPVQVGAIGAVDSQLLDRDYRLARIFDARSGVDAVRLLPGRGYLNFDAVFLVYARKPGTPSQASPAPH